MSNSLALCVATLYWEGWRKCLQTWDDAALFRHRRYVRGEMPILEAYKNLFYSTDEDILAFIHDDVEIYEQDWDVRVMREFRDPTVGMVGFGGALGHGNPQMYKIPYELVQLARRGFISNMRSAEKHGHRFTGEQDVAVFDGFALFVRRSVLEKIGGWPVNSPINYFLYDYWISCEVRRAGFRNRMVGVDCEHLGGRSSSLRPLPDDFEAAHKYIYENYRDVLPYEVTK